MTSQREPGRALRRRSIILLAVFALVSAILTPVTLATTPAAAASGADFQDGNIISDANFTDATSMDAAAVQNFLNSKVSRCSGSNGQPCLKDYSASVAALGTDSLCQGMPGGTMTAAQIIVAAARSCSISPKVLLVMLQKEQGLITSTAPTEWNYRAALGQGCPDTAPCDTAFSGFYRQVYFGARQMRAYLEWPRSYSYQLGWNNILYNPNSGCGTKRVNIQNNATRALYIYTPYTPNTAALANMYGTGDGCSSYGNRNFFRDYSDWFGSPTGDPGAAFIAEKYAALGGASSWLGAAATTVVCGIKDKGCWQLFANGLIVYSPATGAQEMRSAIHANWVTQGYENGWLGYPTTPSVCGIKDNGCWQLFQGGLIMYSPVVGANSMTPAFHTAWVAQGYENGWMGFPLTPTVCGSVNGGCWQAFQSGVIISSPPTGVRSMRPEVHTAWVSQGYEEGWLGYPTSDSQPGAGGGYTQTFQNGTIAVSAAGVATYTGTAATAAQAAVANVQTAATWLGSATTPLVCGSANGGCWRAYQNGVVLYSPATGARAIRPQVQTAWVAEGYEAGWLGYPTGDSVASVGGYSQTFQGGAIAVNGTGIVNFTGTSTTKAYAATANTASANTWLGSATTPVVCGSTNGGCWRAHQHGVVLYSPATGAIAVRPETQSGWVAEGYENGWMGYPSAAPACGLTANGCTQTFQSGTVAYSTASGSRALRPEFVTAWAAQQSQNGWMGYPTTPTVCGSVNGGCWQAFQSGVIISSPATGAKSMRPFIHAAWVAQGYENGWLGYPTSDSQVSGSGYTQAFQGGSITVDAQGNPTITRR